MGDPLCQEVLGEGPIPFLKGLLAALEGLAVPGFDLLHQLPVDGSARPVGLGIHVPVEHLAQLLQEEVVLGAELEAGAVEVVAETGHLLPVDEVVLLRDPVARGARERKEDRPTKTTHLDTGAQPDGLEDLLAGLERKPEHDERGRVQVVLVGGRERALDGVVRHEPPQHLAADLLAAALESVLDDHAPRVLQLLRHLGAELLDMGIHDVRQSDARVLVRASEVRHVLPVQSEEVVVEDQRLNVRVICL
ncbi:MAG: hypothetical protein CMJ89_00480 [Planctomycetes bacterium]|nr:hypothetical protein [Planctomycetota bacterium]